MNDLKHYYKMLRVFFFARSQHRNLKVKLLRDSLKLQCEAQIVITVSCHVIFFVFLL